jgi:hypothetical protein
MGPRRPSAGDDDERAAWPVCCVTTWAGKHATTAGTRGDKTAYLGRPAISTLLSEDLT